MKIPKKWILVPLGILVLTSGFFFELSEVLEVWTWIRFKFILNTIKVIGGYSVITLLGWSLLVSRPFRVKMSWNIEALLASMSFGALFVCFLVYGLGFIDLNKQWLLCLIVLSLGSKVFYIYRLDIKNLSYSWRERLGCIWDLGWCAGFLGISAIVVSWTCPTPSWMDILEIYVAPVQRLARFSDFNPELYLPSSLYPQNRSIPLFSAFFGFVAKLFLLGAHEVLAASLFPQLLLTLLSIYHLGTKLGGHVSGIFAAFFWSMSFSFIHLQDARATTFHFPFSFFALAQTVDLKVRLEKNERIAPMSIVFIAIALSSAFLSHPAEGFYIILLVGFLLLSHFRVLTNLALGFFGIALFMLWFWFPQSSVTLILVILGVSGSSFWLLRIRSGQIFFDSKLLTKLSQHPQRWDLVLFVLGCLALIIPWVPVGHRPNFFKLLDVLPSVPMFRFLWRYPVLSFFLLGIFGVRILFLRKKSGILRLETHLIMLVWFALALPLWIYPFFKLSPLKNASMSYELPLKGLEFWGSGLLAVLVGAILGRWVGWIFEGHSKTWSQLRWAIVGLVVAPVVLPMGPLLFKMKSKNMDSEVDQVGIIATLQKHLSLARHGYWRGHEDSRLLVGQKQTQLYQVLHSLIDQSEIDSKTRILHLAKGSHVLEATPFPAFTGITQDLCVPNKNPFDIHCGDGRIRETDPECLLMKPDWVLMELKHQGSLSSILQSKLKQWMEAVEWKTVFSNSDYLLLRRI